MEIKQYSVHPHVQNYIHYLVNHQINLYNILPIIISYCATPNKNGHVVNTSILFWNRNSNFPYLIQKAKIQRSQTIMLIILHNIIIHIL